jgi:hypothetical protein
MFHIVRKFEDLRGAFVDGPSDGAQASQLQPAQATADGQPAAFQRLFEVGPVLRLELSPALCTYARNEGWPP